MEGRIEGRKERLGRFGPRISAAMRRTGLARFDASPFALPRYRWSQHTVKYLLFESHI